MKKILGLLILFTTLLKAEAPLERRLESVDYRTQGGNTVVLITLSDNSVWKWIPDHYSENLLRKWVKGDQIIIQAVNHPGFLLQNLSKPHFTPPVALSFNSYLLFPTIEGYDYTSDTITLSDGSRWELIYDFNKRTLHHWALADRIIPVKGIHDNYELINIDLPYENRGQIERYVEVVPSEASEGLIALKEDK